MKKLVESSGIIYIATILVAMAISLTLFPKPLGGTDLSSWYLLQVLNFMASIIPAMWIESALLTGSIGLETIPIIAIIIWKTRRGILTFAAIGALIGFTVFFLWQYGRSFFPQYGLHFLVVLCVGNILRIFTPPVAVVLTAARSDSLVETTGQTLFPHRILAMLNEKKFLGAMFFSNQTDNWYALPKADWKEIVRRLVDIVPVVVVDTRIPGDSLKHETGLMLDPKRVSKAIFIVGENGEKPALEANRRQIGTSRLLLITEYELPQLLTLFKQTGNITGVATKARINPLGHWVDIGQLGIAPDIIEIKSAAERILRLEGLTGSLARLSLMEPSPGTWGKTDNDLHRNVIETLANQLESRPALILTPSGLQQTRTESYPEIEKALNEGRVKFLVGRTSNERRYVAILLTGTGEY